MANMVQFQRGLQEVYNRTAWQDNVFYYTTDTKNFYLGNVKLSNGADLAAAIERIAANEADIEVLNQFKDFLLVENESGATGILPQMNAAIQALETKVAAIEGAVGDVDTLSTQNKTVVGAINEVLAAVGTGGTAAVVTMTENASDDYAKVYTLRQGETLIGNINIPKDMVVQSGTIEVNPAGQAEGTYIVLTLANATADKLYINVGTLVDIYRAKANAAQVQIAIDSETREISATIVAGSITATELAENAVVTAKIADENVVKAKLSAGVQASLDKADTAIQQAQLDALNTSLTGAIATAKGEAIADAEGKIAAAQTAAAEDATTKSNAALNAAKAYTDEKAGEGLQVADFTPGTTAGTIAVKGTEVRVAGLGSAAYAGADAFDAEGSAATAESNAKAYTNAEIAKLDADVKSAEVVAGKGVQVQVVEVDGKITTVTVTGNYDDSYDAKGAAAQALTDAKADATSKDNALKTELQTYAENEAQTAYTDAKGYTDAEVAKLTTADATTLSEAKSYAEAKRDEAKTYADQQIAAAALVWTDIFENLN